MGWDMGINKYRDIRDGEGKSVKGQREGEEGERKSCQV